ncbi:Protein of unknown function [Pseudomonas sp. ok272]|uniref:glycosyltransferase family 61 protein n=1 Tax=unclassified Pseudomonas TaxID=196821 RepID=UPI0008B130D2|nr:MULTISPECIES: glycosyltransferase 61 family protein [unclassified Pseudomonas]SEM99324.1 Protein of unknown function [Pseudomonas sp. ok272]SFM89886.1 Protein of unknown function [Pseudomonas sp. ok602]
MKKFFCKNPSKFEKELNAIVETKDTLKVSSLENGIILPLRLTTLSKKNTYEGGVCDGEFNFVAGYFRKRNDFKGNKTCVQAYSPEKEIRYIDEEVVFAGIYFNHFGHAITDGFSRLWYLSKDNLKDKKVVFVNEPGNKYDWMNILCCLGLTKDNVIVLHEDESPIRFRKVHIPDQSFYFFESFHQDMIVPYDLIRRNVASNGSGPERLYLSRTMLKDPDCINEEYFESLYKGLGYEVLHLQNLSFSEQVAAISSAKEIVSTVGTLTHMALFAGNNVSLVGLLRSNSTIPEFQYVIDKVREVNFAYVDVSCNFLPSHGESRVFYIGPNESWRRFFLERYDRLLSGDIYDYIDRTGHNVGEYLRRWINVSLKRRNFKFIAKANIYDVVENLEKIEYSGLKVKVSARKEIGDLYDLGKKLLNKKFNLLISRDGSVFDVDKTLVFLAGGQLKAIVGKSHNNEAYWSVIDGGLKIMSIKESVTHEYFEPKISGGKMFFSGVFKSNPFILLRLEEVVDDKKS